MMRRVLAGVVLGVLVIGGLTVPATAASAAGSTVTGRLVTQTGAPIPNVALKFIYSFGNGEDGTTDVDGKFTIARSSIVRSTISVSATVGKRQESFTVPITKSRNLGEFVFSTQPTISGTISGLKNADSAQVDLVDRSGNYVASVVTDPGTHLYSFRWAKPGTYSLRVSEDLEGWSYLGNTGKFEHARFVRISAAKHLTESISLKKTASGFVAGTVTARSKPSKGTSAALVISRVGAPPSDQDRVYVEFGDKFVSNELAPGTYRVTKWAWTDDELLGLPSLRTVAGASRFTVRAGETTNLGTFSLSASYFQDGWGY